MQIKQIYEIVNDVAKEVLGETAVVQEDLSDVVEVGESIVNAVGYDGYVKKLVNRIGKTIFVNRPYSGRAPKVLMDSWEFGSILQKVHTGLPEATENESWELEDGASYDQDIFYQPKVEVKFYNSKTTFEVPMSFTDEQLKQSVLSREELGSFISMLYASVEKAMTLYMDSLIMRTINNFIAESVYSEKGAIARNLLAEYKELHEDSELTADSCLVDKDFLRYASSEIALASSRMERMSTLFNVGGQPKFTPKDMQRIVMLDIFTTKASMYLDSDTFHDKLVELPESDTVSFWQGSGTDYDFESCSTINVKTSSGHEVEVTGVIACIFDRDALGVSNFNRRTTTHFNGKAEFWNQWYKFDAEFFNDLNENFVVFFVA